MSSEISLSSEECTSRVLAVCLVFGHVEGEGDLINILVIDSLVLVHQLIILVSGDSLARVGLPSQPEGAHESLTLQDNTLHVTPHTLQVTRYKSHVTCHTATLSPALMSMSPRGLNEKFPKVCRASAVSELTCIFCAVKYKSFNLNIF